MSFGEIGGKSGRTEESWAETAGDGGTDGGAGAGDGSQTKADTGSRNSLTDPMIRRVTLNAVT